MSDEMIARARAGAAFLDQKTGTAWRDKIDPDKIAMEFGLLQGDGCGCIIAQAFGDYSAVEKAPLNVDIYQQAYDLGFNVFNIAGLKNESAADLGEAWKIVLAEAA